MDDGSWTCFRPGEYELRHQGLPYRIRSEHWTDQVAWSAGSRSAGVPSQWSWGPASWAWPPTGRRGRAGWGPTPGTSPPWSRPSWAWPTGRRASHPALPWRSRSQGRRGTGSWWARPPAISLFPPRPVHGVTGVSQVHLELLVAGPGTGQADLALLGQEDTLKHQAVVVAVGVPRVAVVLQRIHSEHTVTWDPGKQLWHETAMCIMAVRDLDNEILEGGQSQCDICHRKKFFWLRQELKKG